MTDVIIDPPALPVLTDGRLLLRPPASTDRDTVFAAVMESKDVVGRWMDWCKPDYVLGDTETWLTDCERHWARADGERTFAMFDADSSEFLGCAGMNQFNRVHHFANLGYWVRQSRHRQGIATRSVQSIVAYGFGELKLTRLEIVAPETNAASRGVAQKVGAAFECIARNRVIVHGRPQPAAVYSLIPG